MDELLRKLYRTKPVLFVTSLPAVKTVKFHPLTSTRTYQLEDPKNNPFATKRSRWTKANETVTKAQLTTTKANAMITKNALKVIGASEHQKQHRK